MLAIASRDIFLSHLGIVATHIYSSHWHLSQLGKIQSAEDMELAKGKGKE